MLNYQWIVVLRQTLVRIMHQLIPRASSNLICEFRTGRNGTNGFPEIHTTLSLMTWLSSGCQQNQLFCKIKRSLWKITLLVCISIQSVHTYHLHVQKCVTLWIETRATVSGVPQTSNFSIHKIIAYVYLKFTRDPRLVQLTVQNAMWETLNPFLPHIDIQLYTEKYLVEGFHQLWIFKK